MKLSIILLWISAALAQQPRIGNAQIERHALSGSLENELRLTKERGPGPAWVAYTVPAQRPQHEDYCHPYQLERNGRNSARTDIAPSGPIQLEGAHTMLILYRFENRALSRVEAYSTACEVDAGGLPVHILDGVSAAASIQYLSTLAVAHKQAIMAVALHGDAAADAALEQFVAASQPEKLREDAAFWLGAARGARGVAILKRLAESDPSDRVREKVMFALSVSPETSAVPLMIASAHNDKSPRVRGQALFWLAHKAGQREVQAIRNAIEDDPDTKVKKQAVFALYELPRDQGVNLLIQVARTNKNAEVRKQAMFWLGQTNDPRALQFFEQTLAK